MPTKFNAVRRPARKRRQPVALLAALLALACLWAAASAAAAEPYGEVSRFGGYEAKASAPNRFTRPAGFAVDPESHLAKTPDGNAVFVLDQVENHIEASGGPGGGKGTLRYVLHESSSSGEELGRAEVAESYTDTEHFTDAHPLISLAVDPAQKRVYAIVESIVRETGGEEEPEPVVDEIVAWSTEPNAEGKLVAPQGLATDPVTKSAGLVAGPSALLGSEDASDLFAPEGLVVAEGAHDAGDVVIAAQNGVANRQGGATVLKEIATEGADSGTVVASWEASTTLAPKHEAATSLFAMTDGSGQLGLGLFHNVSGEETFITPLVGVSEDLGSASRIDQDTSNGENIDEALATELRELPNPGGEGFTAEGRGLVNTDYANWGEGGSGSITQLIGGEHNFAALFGHSGALVTNYQTRAEPWYGGTTLAAFWMQGSGNDSEWANVGIRLFNSAGRIIDTIGGGEPKGQPTAGAAALLGSCDIDDERAGIAAGANESVFVLTSTATEQQGEATAGGDEVVEFAPGGPYKCPATSGNIEVDGKEAKPENGEQVAKVVTQEDVPVKFDAISLDRLVPWNPPVLLAGEPFIWEGERGRPREWSPFAFEWNFGDEPAAGPNHDGYTVINEMTASSSPAYAWPSPEAEHEYKTPGTYEAKVRVYGDHGTSVFPVKVQVLGSVPPKAEFSPPSSITAGQAVSFDGSASAPTPGAEVEDYHWEFGDGSAAVDSGADAQIKHTFATPGEYTVKLTIHDDAGAVKEASVEHKVTVLAPVEEKHEEHKSEEQHEESKGETKSETKSETPSNGGGSSPGGSSTQGSTIVGSSPGLPSITPAVTRPKLLTSAQKLANALKGCRKLKPRKQRVTCEKQARKRYAPKAKAKKGKKMK